MRNAFCARVSTALCFQTKHTYITTGGSSTVNDRLVIEHLGNLIQTWFTNDHHSHGIWSVSKSQITISKDRTISQPVLSLSLKLKFIAVGILEMFTFLWIHILKKTSRAKRNHKLFHRVMFKFQIMLAQLSCYFYSEVTIFQEEYIIP